MMALTIVNVSNAIEEDEFKMAINAIGRQVAEDFQPEWLTGAVLTMATLELTPENLITLDGITDAVIYVGQSSQDGINSLGNVLGYHYRDHNNIPYGFVYLDICELKGESWTHTLSHEILELLADPTAALSIAGPAPDSDTSGDVTVFYDLEVCDPTQADSYSIDGIEVCNFVTKKYFGMAGGVSLFTNHNENEDLPPFGIIPGGYFQYRNSSGPQTFPPEFGVAAAAAQSRMGSARRNTRRVLRRLNNHSAVK